MSELFKEKENQPSDKIAFHGSDLLQLTLMVGIILFFVFGLRGYLEPLQVNYSKISEMETRIDFLELENEILRNRRNELLNQIKTFEEEVPQWRRFIEN